MLNFYLQFHFLNNISFFQQSDFLTTVQLDRQIFKITLSLYNNPLISRKAVDDIIKNFNDFIDSTFIPYIEGQIQNELKSKLVNSAMIQLSLFWKATKISLQTTSEYLRFKKYERESLYIPPDNFMI